MNISTISDFTVRAVGVSPENFYIQSATLNGIPYNKSWIAHEDIIEGGNFIIQNGTGTKRAVV